MTLADRVLLVSTIICLPFVYAYFWQGSSEQAEYVDIYDQHDQHQRIQLDQDQQITVQGELGPSIFQIKDKRIRFVKSPCRAKFCVHRAWLSHSGELMACLPNQIYIAVNGGSRRYDAMNY